MPKYIIEIEHGTGTYDNMLKMLTEVQRHLEGWTPPGVEGSPPDKIDPKTSKIPIEHLKHYWSKDIPLVIEEISRLRDIARINERAKESCSNCHCWKKVTRTCRLNPGVPVHVRSFMRDTRLLTLRPHAEADDWCAQWTRGKVN